MSDSDLMKFLKISKKRIGLGLLPCLDGSWYIESLTPKKNQFAAVYKRKDVRLIPNSQAVDYLRTTVRLRKRGKVYKFLVFVMVISAAIGSAYDPIGIGLLLNLIIIASSPFWLLLFLIERMKYNKLSRDFEKVTLSDSLMTRMKKYEMTIIVFVFVIHFLSGFFVGLLEIPLVDVVGSSDADSAISVLQPVIDEFTSAIAEAGTSRV